MVKKILVAVDTQNEFVTGVLGNKDCEAAIPAIVAEIKSGNYAKIMLTQDTHGENYLNTQEGKRLPVIHGQIGTEGYEINKDVIDAASETFETNDIVMIAKPTFGSQLVGQALAEMVAELSVDGSEVEIVFVGFCTGICVISNVVMAKAFCPEQRVCVIEKACACVTPDTHKTAIDAMKTFQVDII